MKEEGYNISMKKQSINSNILKTFLLLFSILVIALLSSQYYFSEKLAIEVTSKKFKHTSALISEHIESINRKNRKILNSNYANKAYFQKINFNYQHRALEDMKQMMNINTAIYSMYFTHNDGSFYQLIKLKKSKKIKNLKLPKNTYWIIRIIKDTKLMTTYLDKNENFISSSFETTDFKAKNRSWYKRAINKEDKNHTLFYEFASIKELGTTYAIELKQKGIVLALDYTLEKISNFLKNQKPIDDSEIFIFTKDGDKQMSSNAKNIYVDKHLREIFFKNKDKNIIHYNFNENKYYTIYKEFNNAQAYLGVKVNSSTLLKPYIETLKYSFVIAILVIVLLIPFIFIATKIITKPIKKLILENEKIKLRQYEDVQNIDTNILEFEELSYSFVAMSKSIQSYEISQEKLLDSIVKVIAGAVDAKSAYTGGHCERVPVIARMLVDEASKNNNKIFKNFKLETKDELKEFELGAWLHDCGKVTTPEYVVDKATKLETINNRIHEVRTRFEVLWRDAQVNYLEALLDGTDKPTALDILKKEQSKLKDDFNFIANVNIGGEFMDDAKQERVKDIASTEWMRNFDDSLGLGEVEALRYDKKTSKKLPAYERLLADKSSHIVKRELFSYETYEKSGFKEEVPEYLYNYGEVYNLCITKGTLSKEERYKINEHVIQSIKMLEQIPFPSNMSKVPEYAGTHHETLIGTGYPRKLSIDDLSIPARIMALADIFEALSASDRPYKKAKTLSESIKILSFMVKDKHIDGDIFKLFLSSGVYLTYAKKYLKIEQIDEVDVKQYI